jgi:hypothetical protein
MNSICKLTSLILVARTKTVSCKITDKTSSTKTITTSIVRAIPAKIDSKYKILSKKSKDYQKPRWQTDTEALCRYVKAKPCSKAVLQDLILRNGIKKVFDKTVTFFPKFTPIEKPVRPINNVKIISLKELMRQIIKIKQVSLHRTNSKAGSSDGKG